MLVAKYIVVPNIGRYQAEIMSRVASASGMDVSAKAIRGQWRGFRPFVDFEEVVFREPANTQSATRIAGAEALRLPRLEASLSWWALAFGELQFGEVIADAPALSLSRGKDGFIYFAGRALNQAKAEADDGQLLDWLLSQPGVRIERATLTWNDALSPGRELRFTDVGLRIEKKRGRHVIGFSAIPSEGIARRVDVAGEFTLRNENGKWRVVGTLFGNIADASLAEIRQHTSVPDALQSGTGNVRVWADLDNSPAVNGTGAVPGVLGPLQALAADVHLVNTRVQIDDSVAPLALAKLAGRIEYRAEEGGFTIASKALEFRTAEGVTSPPADFSFTRQYPQDPTRARGEISANGIDLKVLTALLEYFPIGKDARALAARFSPRGVVRQSRYSWTGWIDQPQTYQLKGALADFASNASEGVPGVTGFTGTVDGDEKGGKFSIASKNFALDASVLATPLKFEAIESLGSWQVSRDAIDVVIDRATFSNADLAGEFSGKYARFLASGTRAKEEKGPGSLDIRGTFSRIKATAVPSYLPNGIARAREYVEFAVQEGDITGADFHVKGAIYDFPFHNGEGGTWRLGAKVKNLHFRYLENWPVVKAIDANLVFENTRFEAKVDSARIFNAPVVNTKVAIDDFGGAPAMLTIDGVAEARAEDAARYLKESPLRDGVGSFTRFVALEGPGKLDLSMKIPLGESSQGKIPTRVTGKYALSRGRARVNIGDKFADVTGVQGAIAFSDASTKSNGLTGFAFGSPLSVSITGGGESGIVTEFVSRAPASALSDLLPFKLPQQISGAADLNGKITSRSSGVEFQIETSLVGLASALPFPMAKRADEARKLRLTMTNAGFPSEQIRLSLAGNALAAGDDPASRIEARFQRRYSEEGSPEGFHGGIASVGAAVSANAIPEGLWFAGKMPQFDFDQWKRAYEGFYPVVAVSGGAATPATDNGPLAGFDFTLGGLVAYGRPFKAMTLRGRRAGDDWRLSMDSPEASGDFFWRPGAFNERGSVRARLARFVLADEVPTSASGAALEPLDADKLNLPALDIVAEKFTYKAIELGKLELRATPQGANWKLDQLNISNGHAKLEMDGLWQRYGDPQKPDGRSRTAVNIKLNTSNLNALFGQFGLAEYMRAGKGDLTGQLSWPGHAYQFQLGTLSGQFKLNASDGQFAKIEPGAGKLLGLISLQSLPSRLTLDFRDIYSEGLAFYNIEGDVRIVNGVMTTDYLRVDGPAAKIRTSGDVYLATETVNLRSRITPQLGEGAAIGAGVLLTPVVGVGVLAVSKLLQGALSYELTIKGRWDAPEVEDVKKNALPPSESATPSSTPPAVPTKSK